VCQENAVYVGSNQGRKMSMSRARKKSENFWGEFSGKIPKEI